MNSRGPDDISPSPSFVRSIARSGSFYWEEAGDKYAVPECHPHDVAWIISLLYGATTKSLGQVFDAPSFRLGEQQIKALIDKYTKFYVNTLDSTGSQQLARREANIRLTKAAANFARR